MEEEKPGGHLCPWHAVIDHCLVVERALNSSTYVLNVKIVCVPFHSMTVRTSIKIITLHIGIELFSEVTYQFLATCDFVIFFLLS